MKESTLKFLVDFGVGKKVEEYLQEQGYDTKAVRAIDTRMPDVAGCKRDFRQLFGSDEEPFLCISE